MASSRKSAKPGATSSRWTHSKARASCFGSGGVRLLALRFRFSAPRLVDGALYGLIVLVVLGWTLTPSAPDLWDRAAGALPPWAVFVLGLWGLHLGAHWLVLVGFAALDRWLPSVIEPFRIQPGAKVARPADLWQVVLTNQLVAMPLTLAVGWGLLELRGWEVTAPLPGPGRLLLELAVLALLTELSFWSAHRLLHLPWWFRRVHHVHHRYRAAHPCTDNWSLARKNHLLRC